ncbi:hypothetical protein PM082_016526 [Marasmius tenuissimus]|nr:hypothetical protein PM082_016526 [Marasmius tenuissimus]
MYRGLGMLAGLSCSIQLPFLYPNNIIQCNMWVIRIKVVNHNLRPFIAPCSLHIRPSRCFSWCHTPQYFELRWTHTSGSRHMP